MTANAFFITGVIKSSKYYCSLISAFSHYITDSVSFTAVQGRESSCGKGEVAHSLTPFLPGDLR